LPDSAGASPPRIVVVPTGQLDPLSMSAGKSVATAGAFIGAATMLPTAGAFAALGAPMQQHGGLAALRGAPDTLVPPSSTPCAAARLPAVLGTAAGVAVVGSLVGHAGRGTGRKQRASNVARNFNKEKQIGRRSRWASGTRSTTARTRPPSGTIVPKSSSMAASR
jgi:hypothetical protein